MNNTHNFNLTENQISKLNSGKTLRLKNENLTGNVVVNLSTDQACRLRKAMRLNKGFDLKFMETQTGGNPLAVGIASGVATEIAAPIVKNVAKTAWKGIKSIGSIFGLGHMSDNAFMKRYTLKNGQTLFLPPTLEEMCKTNSHCRKLVKKYFVNRPNEKKHLNQNHLDILFPRKATQQQLENLRIGREKRKANLEGQGLGLIGNQGKGLGLLGTQRKNEIIGSGPFQDAFKNTQRDVFSKIHKHSVDRTTKKNY